MSYVATYPKHWVGFESLFNDLEKYAGDALKKIPNWPPYNIRKLDDTKYVIEIACAGFSKSDIELTMSNDELHIDGKMNVDPNASYLHKGIAERAFNRSFTLADSVVVKNASLVNGMLKVFLEHVIPENKKPKIIPIGETEDLATVKDDKQFLAE
jgi:molecular chaperone IbpA